MSLPEPSGARSLSDRLMKLKRSYPKNTDEPLDIALWPISARYDLEILTQHEATQQHEFWHSQTVDTWSFLTYVKNNIFLQGIFRLSVYFVDSGFHSVRDLPIHSLLWISKNDCKKLNRFLAILNSEVIFAILSHNFSWVSRPSECHSIKKSPFHIQRNSSRSKTRSLN